MITSIEININDNLIYIDALKLYIFYNGRNINITKEELNTLISMIVLWDKEMIDPKIIDGEQCTIKVNTTEGVDIYNYRGKTPNNYQEYKRVLGGLLWRKP